MEKNIYQILQDWHDLLNNGVITEDEFAEKKKELLGEEKKKQLSSFKEDVQILSYEEQAIANEEYNRLFNNKSWVQKNKDWLIGLSIPLLIVLLIWYFTKNTSNLNNNTESVIPSISTTNSYYLVNANEYNLVHFYKKPDITTKKASYFNSQDTVYVEQIENGFGYIEFNNKRGQISKGWLRLQDLEYCSECSK